MKTTRKGQKGYISYLYVVNMRGEKRDWVLLLQIPGKGTMDVESIHGRGGEGGRGFVASQPRVRGKRETTFQRWRSLNRCQREKKRRKSAVNLS